MAIFNTIDTSFKGIANYMIKCETKYKNQKSANTGGFISPRIEKEFGIAISYWRKKVLNSSNPCVKGLELITWKTSGDIRKGPKEFVNVMIKDAAIFKLITNKFKTNDNINKFSFLRLYLMAYEILTNAKYVSLFQKAYAICKENKGKPSGSAIADMFVMTHTVLAHFVACCIGTINTWFYHTINANHMSWDKYDEVSLESFIAQMQRTFRTTIGHPGFTTIELYSFLESLGNPLTEFNKALKVEKDTLKEISSNEDFNYYQASESMYLINRQGDPHRGEELILPTILIIVGIIAGIWVIFKGIPFLIYKIATLKTDIVRYIILENEMLRQDITETDAAIEKETNEAALKKLQSIKTKQEEWRRRFDKFIADWSNDMYETEAQAEAQVETDQKEIDEEEKAPKDLGSNDEIIL